MEDIADTNWSEKILIRNEIIVPRFWTNNLILIQIFAKFHEFSTDSQIIIAKKYFFCFQNFQ